MAMAGDGKTKYDHDFDGSNVELGGCHEEIRNKASPTTCRITYLDGDSFKVLLFMLITRLICVLEILGFGRIVLRSILQRFYQLILLDSQP
jgi:Legume-like lectin family